MQTLNACHARTLVLHFKVISQAVKADGFRTRVSQNGRLLSLMAVHVAQCAGIVSMFSA